MSKMEKEKGQALVEFSMVLPILILIFMGMFFAAFYAYRASAADWSVFINGVANGSYKAPANAQALQKVTIADIRGATQYGPAGNRQVRSEINLVSARPWIYGINLKEVQNGSTRFRQWRFYAGPPTADSEFD